MPTHLHDEVIADLKHKRDKARRDIVVRRVPPDEKKRVHDWFEEVHQCSELIQLVKLLKVLLKRFQEL